MRNACLMCLIAALLALAPAPALAEGMPGEDAFMIEKGQALTRLMHSFADSDYMLAMSSGEDVLEIGRQVAACDFSRPTGAYVVRISPDLWREVFENELGGWDVSEEVEAYLIRRANASLASILAAGSGASSLAALSILSAGESYPQPEGFSGEALVCLVYADMPYASVVSFTRSGDGIISGAAMFVPAPEGIEPLVSETLWAAFGGLMPEGGVTYAVYEEDMLQGVI